MTAITSAPSASRHLMIATYVLGGAALAMSFWANAGGRSSTAAAWASIAVGVTGVISFVRHAVFHRSDAARMGWDYGRRNDFQIEVGIANLAWGLAALAALALGWGTAAQGAVVVVFGLYMLGATILHAGELAHGSEEGGGRPGPLLATGAFAVCLLIAGASAVSA